MKTPQVMVMYCLTCSAIRYRSTKQLAIGDDIRPTDFTSVDGAPPPPTAGPPLCHECQSLMKLMPEDTANAMLGQGPALTVSKREALQQAYQEQPTPTTPEEFFKSLMFTVFEVKANEEIKEIQDAGPVLMIITNRRVIALKKS